VTFPVDRHQHITIEDDGRLLAEARVRTTREAVHAALRVESGKLPPGTSARLVDAVIELSTAEPGTPMHVTLPAGDAEMLGRLRERCAGVLAAANGTRCRVQASTPAT